MVYHSNIPIELLVDQLLPSCTRALKGKDSRGNANIERKYGVLRDYCEYKGMENAWGAINREGKEIFSWDCWVEMGKMDS